MQQDLAGDFELSTSESIGVSTATFSNIGCDVYSKLNLEVDSADEIDHLLFNKILLNIQSNALINHAVSSELNDTEIYYNTVNYSQPVLFIEEQRVSSTDGITNVFTEKQRLKLQINQAIPVNQTFAEKVKTKAQIVNSLPINQAVSIKTIYKPVLNGRFYLNGVINLSGTYTA
ncbi:hypothetical protein [Acetobacterium wieringae]|uniref:hypothetical protein n=1 Tax=Acetobacterium wieringae TaxID=52694 RepID=UPI002B201999|nr:hypothetical protein [Acetobacterium wieringae]MEA4805074.1 hypothetical protein [Acetobacterium wieringae]